jgi:hypothetical protein
MNGGISMEGLSEGLDSVEEEKLSAPEGTEDVLIRKEVRIKKATRIFFIRDLTQKKSYCYI